jgi:hypothetical protein
VNENSDGNVHIEGQNISTLKIVFSVMDTKCQLQY